MITLDKNVESSEAIRRSSWHVDALLLLIPCQKSHEATNTAANKRTQLSAHSSSWVKLCTRTPKMWYHCYQKLHLCACNCSTKRAPAPEIMDKNRIVEIMRLGYALLWKYRVDLVHLCSVHMWVRPGLDLLEHSRSQSFSDAAKNYSIVILPVWRNKEDILALEEIGTWSSRQGPMCLPET